MMMSLVLPIIMAIIRSKKTKSRAAQDLLFLEFQNEHLSMFDPCPKEFADFLSEFFDHVLIVPFFFSIFAKMPN